MPMTYYLRIDDSEQGPYTIEQIRAGVAKGTITGQQLARTEHGNDWRPLSQIARLIETNPALSVTKSSSNPNANPVAIQPPRLQSSSLAGMFHFLAITNFIVGAICILMTSNVDVLTLHVNSSIDRFTLIALFASCFGGGLTLLAIAKVIDYLHEIVFRLRNLEQMARDQKGSSGQ